MEEQSGLLGQMQKAARAFEAEARTARAAARAAEAQVQVQATAGAKAGAEAEAEAGAGAEARAEVEAKAEAEAEAEAEARAEAKGARGGAAAEEAAAEGAAGGEASRQQEAELERRHEVELEKRVALLQDLERRRQARAVHAVYMHVVHMRWVCVRCVCGVRVRLSDCRWHTWLQAGHMVTGWAHMLTGLVPLWLQAVGAVCVRLSEGLARSGCVAPGVTLLCDAGCTSWGFDRLQARRLQPYVSEAATLCIHRGCASRRCDGM